MKQTNFSELPSIVDLHNDRSFFITARHKPLKDCSEVSICTENIDRRHKLFFSLWRPSGPYKPGHPWYLTEEQASEQSQISSFTYMKQAIHDIKDSGLQITNNPNDLLSSDPMAFLGVEGAAMLFDKGHTSASINEDWVKNRVNLLKNQKVSYISPAWSGQDVFFGSEMSKKGITREGKILVRHLIRAGILIDLSHASDRAIEDFYTMTGGRYPLFFSHTSIRHFSAEPRSISKATLKRIKETAGAAGIMFHNPFISKKQVSDIDDVADHFMYIIENAGADYVALGSDFDGFVKLPTGLSQLSDIDLLLKVLAGRGTSNDELGQIRVGNIYRVLSMVQSDKIKKIFIE